MKNILLIGIVEPISSLSDSIVVEGYLFSKKKLFSTA